MVGVVTADREATVRLIARGPFGAEEAVVAVIDTGFNGYLTLPRHLVAALNLNHHSFTSAMLGDGSHVSLSRYEGIVLWDGREREILALEADGGPLVGMALLQGHRLAVEVVPGGLVQIEPM